MHEYFQQNPSPARRQHRQRYRFSSATMCDAEPVFIGRTSQLHTCFRWHLWHLLLFAVVTSLREAECCHAEVCAVRAKLNGGKESTDVGSWKIVQSKEVTLSDINHSFTETMHRSETRSIWLTLQRKKRIWNFLQLTWSNFPQFVFVAEVRDALVYLLPPSIYRSLSSTEWKHPTFVPHRSSWPSPWPTQWVKIVEANNMLVGSICAETNAGKSPNEMSKITFTTEAISTAAEDSIQNIWRVHQKLPNDYLLYYAQLEFEALASLSGPDQRGSILEVDEHISKDIEILRPIWEECKWRKRQALARAWRRLNTRCERTHH